MGVFNNITEVPAEVDIILAGGGTAACIVASRLAEADPSLSILIIERGQNNHNVPNIVNPAVYLGNIAPTSRVALFYKGNKAPQLANRQPIVPCGGTLGGGSSINFMMYTRAQRWDFDAWETPGWSADELLPFLKKLETYHGDDPKNIHGRNGPVNVSDGTFRATAIERDFIRAAGEVGWPEIKDLQDFDSVNGFQRWKRYVCPEGKRQDTAHRYLHPLLQDGKHPNLHVLVETLVARVLLDDDKRAVGVECLPNPDFQATLSLTMQPKKTIKAKKLVIVSSGACGSPPILERSGIGDPSVLEKAGISTLVDLPGVGRDYQDHNLVLFPYLSNLKPDESLDGILSGRNDFEKMTQEKDKLVGWNGIDVAAKLRPTDAEVAALGPEFQAAWDRDFASQPNRPLMLMATVSAFLGDHSSIPPGQYFTTGNYTAYPYSRGHIHVTGPECQDPLDFDVGFLTDEHDIDLKKQVWAYKKQREIMRRTDMFRGELALGHPKFAADSAAAVLESMPSDGAQVARDIEYTAEDDKAIEQFIRENVETTWHSLGTNIMAPREKFGVVDESLNVHGTKGLKVADLSIPPVNVAANTNNTALVIGEKAADIILGELGLRSD